MNELKNSLVVLFGLFLNFLVAGTGANDDITCPSPWPEPSTSPFRDSCSCNDGQQLIVRCSKLRTWPASTPARTSELLLDGTTSNSTLKSYKLSMFAPNLQKFSCTGCGIRRIEQFAFFGLNHIRDLILDDNEITTVDSFAFAAIPTLKTLNLANSGIVTIEHSAFMGLQDMDLLSLERNRLEEIKINAFKNVSSIKTVNFNAVTASRLKSYSLQGLRDIHLISFTHSKLTKIEAYAFYGVNNVTTINFHSSDLKEILPNAFVGIGKVRDIRLKNTQISTIRCGVLEGLDCVNSVNWGGSPFRCDCNLQWMVELSVNTSRDKTKELRCASPYQYKDMSPFEFDKTTMGCNEEETYMGCGKLDTRVPRVKALERYIEEVMAVESSAPLTATLGLGLLTLSLLVIFSTIH